MEQSSKKTMRHFYCRDVLWETFEQMATDFDCSIDYLINESMRTYARAKSYPSQSTGTTGHDVPAQGPPRTPQLQGAALGLPPTPAPGRLMPITPPHPPIGRSTAPRPVARPTEDVGDLLGESAGPILYLMFNNQKLAIDKDQFIIGRGSKTSDLPIKDGNISRKHAAVIRRNGTFYIKDLGSTNGIDFKGMRIDNKRIDEGDVFHLCDYELKFTYKG